MNVFDSARLIIYRINKKGLEIFLVNTGSNWELPKGNLSDSPQTISEQDRFIELDPVFETVDREELIEGPKAVWAEILCKDANPQTVRSLQSELFKRGYYTGPINGRQSPSLDAAVNDYQLDQGLATGGITFETLQALGIGA